MSQRVDIPTAAEALGITEVAVRRRLQRKSLKGGKDAAGRWYVLLPERDTTGTPGGIPDGTGPVHQAPAPEQAELVVQLRSEIEHLRQQLDRAQQAEAEGRRIIAMLVSRPLELPAQASPAPSQSSQEPSQVAIPPIQVAMPVSPPTRPWWRRWLG